MEEILKRVILENQEIIFAKTMVPRKYTIPETDNITVLTGIRRCGKTYILYEIARTLDPEQVLFLDFEDERLIALNSLNHYDIIIDCYKILYPNRQPVLFFDEIQNLKNWHFYLKRLHAAGYKIYVTGSNAHLISREIATYLKGRSLETNIFPFSFQEFLNLKNVTLQPKDAIINQPKILNQFDEYLQFGGFPEVIKVEEADKRAVAKNIYQLLFYKDLVSKFEKNDVLLKLIVNKIAENICKDFSITSLANKINAVFKTSVPTVTDYFHILPEPFLTANIYPYRDSFVQRESKRKTYLTDNSFIWLNRVSPEVSRLFENQVYNFLQRNHHEIFYYKTTNNLEVDFLVSEGETKKLIQACYSLENSDTRDREIRALLKAMDEQNLNTGYIYTYNLSEQIKTGNKTIVILPLWREMLIL